jgi:hypothetical protein
LAVDEDAAELRDIFDRAGGGGEGEEQGEAEKAWGGVGIHG